MWKQKKYKHIPSGVEYFMTRIDAGGKIGYLLVSTDVSWGEFAQWVGIHLTEEEAFNGRRDKFIEVELP